MIKLSFEDRLQIKEKNFDYFNVHYFDFSCGSFYVKKCMGNESFMELFAKKVFDMVGIICANYYLLNDNFIISEDLNKLDNFLYITNLRGIKLRNVTLDMVRDSLTEIVCNKEDIKLQINIMHFIDILFSNTDRHTNNYGITIDNNGNGFLVVFDNALFLNYFNSITKPMSCCVYNSSFVKIRECNHFIGNLSELHKKYIYEIFCRFNPDTVIALINNVEREHNIKLQNKGKILRQYTKNYFMINSILRKHINSEIRKDIRLSKSI